MYRSALLSIGLLTASSALAHHASCVTSPVDGFMSCGAHSGRVSFELQNYGDVTEETDQLILCSNETVNIQDLKFSWVEADDKSTHFAMNELKYRQISDTCTALGGLDFTPPADYADAPRNAWKLDIYVDGVPVPSSVYVEALPAKKG